MLTENNGNIISQIFIKYKKNQYNINNNGSNNVLNKPFTMNELKKAIKHLKKNKATDYDNISNELILSFFNLTLSKGIIPSKWCLDHITPIHKI